ncbi:MAG: hypothetical protein ACP5SH_17135 [Syntrophobacteraceae bacterium]
MTWLDFKETADMSRKLVEACMDVRRCPYLEDFVLAAFEKEIQWKASVNEAADTQMDNFSDGFRILRKAVDVAENWMHFWSDAHHNGRPSRWLKVTEELVLNGKSESFLLLNKQGNRLGKGADSPWEETWELHQFDHARLRAVGVDGLIKNRPPASEFWQVTPFALRVCSGRRIEGLEHGEERLDDFFYAFVFPGLEILGYQTPALNP